MIDFILIMMHVIIERSLKNDIIIPTHNNEGFHIEASLADCVWAWWDSGLYRQHLLNTTQLLGTTA